MLHPPKGRHFQKQCELHPSPDLPSIPAPIPVLPTPAHTCSLTIPPSQAHPSQHTACIALSCHPLVTPGQAKGGAGGSAAAGCFVTCDPLFGWDLCHGQMDRTACPPRHAHLESAQHPSNLQAAKHPFGFGSTHMTKGLPMFNPPHPLGRNYPA